MKKNTKKINKSHSRQFLKSIKDSLSDNKNCILNELETINNNQSVVNNLVLKNKVEIYNQLIEIKKEIVSLSQEININVVIPVLLLVMDNLYFNPEYIQLKRMGPAVKNCISILLLFGDRNNKKKSTKLDSSFKNLIKKVILYEFIKPYDIIFSGENQDVTFELSIHENGVYIDKELEIFLKENYLFPEVRYGDGQRSVTKHKKLLLKNTFEYYRSLDKIINGIEPKNIDYFKGSFFEEFGGINNNLYTKFWKGLKLRLELLVKSCNGKENYIDEKKIKIFKLSELNEIISNNFQNEESVKEGLILSADFLDKEYLENFNKIVYRPLCPIFNGEYLVTSTSNLIDSINNYIESFIFKMNTTNTISEKDESLFAKLFSKPFEVETIKLLNDFGYKSGEVTVKGAWRGYIGSEEFIEEITNNTFKEQNTGEIDCLAINREKGIIYVIECKVLQFPKDFSSYRNRISKLTKEYREQLQKKTDFVKSKFKGYSIRPILLLDNSFTTLRQYESNPDNLRILTFETLKKELKN